MSRLTNAEEFASYVETDFTWRIRELSDLRVGVRGTDNYRSTLRKAALPLVYAHWEGHVKFVSEAYLSFVSRRKFPISKIKRNFSVIALSAMFEQLSGRNASYGEKLRIIHVLEEAFLGRFASVPKSYLNTGGNLGYGRFCDICQIMDLQPEHILDNGDYLDKFLLDKRNHIAHGSEKTVEAEELETAIEFVITSMRSYRDSVVNLIALEHYKI